MEKMKVLLTGSSGFLGSTIAKSLSNVLTLGRSNSDIIVDLALDIPKLSYCNLVIHAAGKAHSTSSTIMKEQDFFNVNVNGSKNLLKGLEICGLPKAFIFISSVAVYGRISGNLINERNSLEAKDSYGVSKVQAERIIMDWCKKNNIVCTILRLPLIAGPNPPGNLGAMINGIKNGYYFNVSGGNAKRSVVLAKDVSSIIPKVAEIGGVYNLTDGYHPSFKEISSLIARQLGKKDPVDIPNLLAKGFAQIGDMFGNRAPINTQKLIKMKSDLTFDDSYAREILGWSPTDVLQGFRIS